MTDQITAFTKPITLATAIQIVSVLAKADTVETVQSRVQSSVIMVSTMEILCVSTDSPVAMYVRIIAQRNQVLSNIAAMV
jgi:hypothetical protein